MQLLTPGYGCYLSQNMKELQSGEEEESDTYLNKIHTYKRRLSWYGY
jgi:hypothetical protein